MARSTSSILFPKGFLFREKLFGHRLQTDAELRKLPGSAPRHLQATRAESHTLGCAGQRIQGPHDGSREREVSEGEESERYDAGVEANESHERGGLGGLVVGADDGHHEPLRPRDGDGDGTTVGGLHLEDGFLGHVEGAPERIDRDGLTTSRDRPALRVEHAQCFHALGSDLGIQQARQLVR